MSVTTVSISTGRQVLAATPGRSDVLFVHQIGDDVQSRRRLLQTASDAGAWVVDLRGHGESSRPKGHVYRIVDFALDAARLVDTCFERAPVIVGYGAGSLVAALTAAACGDRVAGLDLLQCAGDSGWQLDETVTEGERPRPNARWFDAMRSGIADRAGTSEGERSDDPILEFGPPEPIMVEALRATLRQVSCAWWSGRGAAVAQWLPTERRRARPHTSVAGALAGIAVAPAAW
jgi:pimeloyl-ACP methyl ester carboxylesterase